MHTFGSAAMARNASTRRQGLPPPEANPPEERLAPHEASMVDLLQAPLSPTASLPSPLGRTDRVAASVSADAGMASSVMASAASRGAQHRSTQRSRRQGRAALRAGDESFAWTEKAVAAMLKLRYGALRDQFRAGRSSREIRAAWLSLAAETSRVGGLLVTPKQCKSKHTHMHRQWTEYRAAQLETGNRTDQPLQPPPCYVVMCDEWGDSAGMGSTVFYSSDRHRADEAQHRRPEHHIQGSFDIAELSSNGAESEKGSDEDSVACSELNVD
ncbi:hypothetical protein PF001_g29764 [Phytophthora fragariae]|uniref:Myb/SANT-like DNA-binding domain-containing protein n=1 Tax=Phytophthora fragariae TaxID=53985 RepID=A0A6A4B8E0_9STRA|nr:hypothetical protein PF001_g29764 [Phytophthora fragariae]